jgi:hypothetical protein
MRIFMLVLTIVICGFANAYLALSKGSSNDSEFVDGGFFSAIIYSYRMNLGDFNIDVFGDSV